MLNDDFKTPFLLADRAKKRGVVILNDKPCQKCREPNAIYYYVKKDGKTKNGCVWCYHLNGKTPKAVTADIAEVMPDGTPIYEGRCCTECGSMNHMAVKAHGGKAGACYECAIRKASDKVGQVQISRERQLTKKQTNQFVIQSIERSGSVLVAPRDLSEYYLVRALINERNRLNKFTNNGDVWEIGHYFPASGGGTEYRGKATVNNLVLVRKSQNRKDGDNLPTEWKTEQVVRVGEAFTEMTQREAATAWRERMGWNDITAAEKTRQKAAEVAENAKHTAEVKRLAVQLANIEELRITPADEWAEMLETVSQRIERIDRKQAGVIKRARKNREDIFISEEGLTEEALSGLNARYRIVFNTIKQLIEIFEREEKSLLVDPFDELPNAEERNALYLEFLQQSQIVKTAFLLWASDTLVNSKRDVQGFTHPLLSKLNKAYVWGTRTGADGRQWLCGWLVKDGELIEQDMRQGATWQSVGVQEWKEQEASRKATVENKFRDLVRVGLNWCADVRRLTEEKPVDTGSIFDESDIQKHVDIVRRLRRAGAERKCQAFERARSKLNTWWSHARTLSARDLERQATEYYELFQPFTEPATAGRYLPEDYARTWQAEHAPQPGDVPF